MRTRNCLADPSGAQAVHGAVRLESPHHGAQGRGQGLQAQVQAELQQPGQPQRAANGCQHDAHAGPGCGQALRLDCQAGGTQPSGDHGHGHKQCRTAPIGSQKGQAAGAGGELENGSEASGVGDGDEQQDPPDSAAAALLAVLGFLPLALVLFVFLFLFLALLLLVLLLLLLLQTLPLLHLLQPELLKLLRLTLILLLRIHGDHMLPICSVASSLCRNGDQRVQLRTSSLPNTGDQRVHLRASNLWGHRRHALTLCQLLLLPLQEFLLRLPLCLLLPQLFCSLLDLGLAVFLRPCLDLQIVLLHSLLPLLDHAPQLGLTQQEGCWILNLFYFFSLLLWTERQGCCGVLLRMAWQRPQADGPPAHSPRQQQPREHETQQAAAQDNAARFRGCWGAARRQHPATSP
mmetsp:Transcript_100678/g.280393  ORF Transcript_100678/g.280393 Transcript_100678/m.280393 type:complete len:404 (+) Transcript_100678:700-1911(+)